MNTHTEYRASQPHESRVFGIGLFKTGTLSLFEALNKLGYRSLHWMSQGHLLNPWNVADFTAAVDLPVAALFQAFDRVYPGSKFIYTERDMDSWLESCRKHVRPLAELRKEKVSYVGEIAVLHKAVFGVEDYEREAWRQGALRHAARVRAYFTGREEDLLVLRVCEGEGWERLCAFLGKGIPSGPFPHANDSVEREGEGGTPLVASV